jgi:hypothetical protein
MPGICFYFENNDIDVWSGRRIDLDAWNYAEQAAGDIERVIIINKSDVEIQIANHYEVVNDIPILEGRVAHVCCPWDSATEKVALWDFDHQVDWYVFGPANGWAGQILDLGVYVPISGQGALHAVHVAAIVLTHRYGALGSWR